MKTEIQLSRKTATWIIVTLLLSCFLGVASVKAQAADPHTVAVWHLDEVLPDGHREITPDATGQNPGILIHAPTAPALVEGKFGKTMRMTLTSATFAIMSGVATDSQIASIWKMANRYLRDKKLKGFHLNTNFGAEQHSLGRAFSFSYGDKENGAFFNHMAVMFAYALYSRGFVKEGFEALNSIYKMAQDSATSKIYPCLPEYFNSEGQGMYCYLTGSASWFVLTLLTQACGIRGEYGNLIIEPKLTSQQFQGGKEFSVATNFADKRIEVCFLNPPKKDYPDYTIQSLCLNGQIIEANLKRRRSIIMRSQFLELAKMPVNKILVALD